MLFKVLTLLFVSLVFGQKERAPEYRLNSHLLNNYNPAVRPVLSSSNRVETKVKLSLLDITDLDANSQKIKARVWLHLEWRDEFLTWNQDDFSRQKQIRLSPEDIWTPDVTLLLGELEPAVERNTHVLAQSNGSVLWIASKELSARCEINLRFFPYDRHTCSFTFGSWVYNGDQVDLSNGSSSVDLTLYGSGKWNVASSRVLRNEQAYPCCQDVKYPQVTFEIEVARRCTSYSLSIILPLIILTLFSLLIFLFPIDSIARLAFALFVLTGFLLLLFYIQTNIASASQNIPLISIYCLVLASIVAFAILFIILLANFNSKYGRLPSVLRNTLFRSCVQNEAGQSNDPNKIPNEWRSAASCLDTLLFYLFFVLIVVFIIIFIILFAAL